MKITACKGCQGSIVWVESPAGKSMPVDALPVPFLNAPAHVAYYTLDVLPDRIRAVKLEAPRPNERVHISHFVTCPNRDRFTKGKR